MKTINENVKEEMKKLGILNESEYLLKYKNSAIIQLEINTFSNKLFEDIQKDIVKFNLSEHDVQPILKYLIEEFNKTILNRYKKLKWQ